MFKKGNKGITLIALIITIIVLLILAGVTIAQITGQDSAPQKAADAKLENEKGAAKDEATMLAAQYVQEYMEKKYVQNIKVEETTGNVQDKKLEVGQDGNSIYKVSGVELPKMLADGEETIPAIVGDYVAQQFSSRASQEGSYNYSTSGRSLTIKTRSNEDLVSGTINDDGTITWDGSSSGGSETSGATTLTINGQEITLTADNAKDYYGTTVKVINGVEYGLFYIDFAGKYGDAGAVYLRAKSSIGSTGVNGYGLGSGSSSSSDAGIDPPSDAIEIMKQINPDWASNRGNNLSASEYLASEREAAYLCDEDNSLWSGIRSSFDSSYSNYVNYVIGAPSVEMFLDSYNAKYPNSSPKYTTAFRSADYEYPGYLYSSNNGSSYNSYYSEAIQIGDSTVGGMYRNQNDSEWLASPLSGGYDDYVCNVNYGGYLDNDDWDDSRGVAPLVSLKSGVHLVAVGSRITVDGTDIDLGQFNATTVAQYYGTTVKTINGVKYGLFYVDYAGKYGAAGTVYLRAKSSVEYTKLDETLSDADKSSAIGIMKQINPDWARTDARGSVEYSNYYSSEKGATYLCNPNNSLWSGIRDEFDSNYVNYVIGAPSVEMFLDSYNAKYPNSSPKYTTAFRSADYEYPGYLYYNGNSYSDYCSETIQGGDSTVGDMYRGPYTEWLASPLSYSIANLVCCVHHMGHLSSLDCSFNINGVAPLVSLKSGVDLTN